MQNKPNVNLRVFRRQKTDMTLIYNKTELLSSKYDYQTSVVINKNNIHFYEETAKAKDNSEGDVCIFIPYQENELDDISTYNVEVIFTPKLKKFSGKIESIEVDLPDALHYYIIVQPRGILSSNLKDNKSMFTQSFFYDPETNKWERAHIIKEKDFNKLLVQDDKVIELLSEIKQILLKK